MTDMPASSAPPHILVVDDEEELIRLIVLFLRKSGYAVSSAAHTKDAYALIAGTTFDAILTDVMMPGEDGISFLATIHQQHPDVPVIIMTGYAQLQLAVDAIKNGAFDFLSKPFDLEYLSRVISKAVTYSGLLRLEKNYREDLERTVTRRTDELKQALEQLDTANSALLKAASEKSAFLATITHEMRTPMNGVIGALDLLADEELTGPQREYLDMARQSADTMMQLVDQVLSFGSGMGHGALPAWELFDPAELVDNLESTYRPRFHAKGLVFDVRRTPALPARIRSDREQVGRLLDILLGNALKFTDQGGVRLEVSVHTGDNGDERLRFDVTDSGIGIPGDMIEKIFEPFVQVDGSLTRRFGGAGLGLSIARQIALLLNGTLWAESTPGNGSSFHFSMPVCSPSPITENACEMPDR